MKFRGKRSWVLLLFCSSAMVAKAQLPSLENDYGQKIYQYSDSSKVEAYVTDAKEKQVKDKREYFYYKAGKINSVQGYMTGKVLNGPYRVYLAGGKLVQKGGFNKGLKDGNWVSWSSTGKITRIENYRNGIRSGQDVHYNQEGKKILATNYVNGRKDGEELAYDSSGKVVGNTLYIRGKTLPSGPGLKESFKRLKRKKQDSMNAISTDTASKKKVITRKR